jgi:hypothetical protein
MLQKGDNGGQCLFFWQDPANLFRQDLVDLLCTKKSLNVVNHVSPVKLTYGHRHQTVVLQDYRIRPDLHDGSDNHLKLSDFAGLQITQAFSRARDGRHK